MSAKLFAWIGIAWLTFAYSDWIVNQVVGSTSDIDVVFSFKLATVKQFIGIPIPLPNTNYLTSLWNLTSWNFWFFRTESGFWARYFFGLPTILAMTYYLYNNIMPVMINLAGAAGSLIRAINPFRLFRLGT